MVSVLIADDEEDIIALVKKLIVYPQVKVIGEADNGEDAYAQILEKKPDLVIIDISMPKMSGLEVIEKVKRTCPDMAFVVISGFRDFEYAQSALRFGVSDYLLKPIKKQELNDILKKVDLRLQSANQMLEKRDLMQKNINESRKLIRMNYVRQLLHSINGEPMEIPQMGGEHVFAFGNGGFQCMLVKLDEGHLEEPVQSLLQETGELLRKGAAEYCQEIEFAVVKNKMYFLLNYYEGKSQEEINQFYKICENLLKDINYKFGFIRVTAGFSQVMRSKEQMRRAYKQAEFAILERLENQAGILWHFSPEREMVYRNEFCFQSWANEKRIGSAIERLSEPEVEEAFQKCWEEFVVRKKIPGAAYKTGVKFVSFMHMTLQGILPADIINYSEYEKIYAVMDNCFEPAQIKKAVMDYIGGFISWCAQAAHNGEAKPVRMAKSFVEEHYAEAITLEDIARYVCLSPTYFSSLFKTETGQGFLSYLQNMRIDRAKQLLRETSVSIGDIAKMVGYADVKYFSKLFMKETGIKPSVYRKFYAR